ncbi:MAG: Lrp/AsnC family transcriptional regulator [Euryarchaeota archaeon]|nr:Lrp/AsnC family transcriptional regulator [Euryarchaeota archaeon]
MGELTDLEYRVLGFLKENSKRSFSEMSDELRKSGIDVTRQSVAYKVKSLCDKGIIKRFTIEIDYDRLGYELPILIFVRHAPVNIETFRRVMSVPSLKDDERVHHLFTLSGSPGFAILGRWESKEKYAEWKTKFLDKIKKDHDFPVHEFEEFLIWDFYKHMGVHEIPRYVKGITESR